MKNIFLTLALFTVFTVLNAQTNGETIPLFQVEKCSELSEEERYACSNQNIMTYISEIVYPDIAKENKEEGRVFLKFMITKNGDIINLEVAKSSGSTYLDRAAIHHVSKMPSAWTPAKKDGENIDFEFVLPINFAL